MVNLEETNGHDTSTNASVNESVNEDGALNTSHDPFYPPIVSLPEVDVPTGEDNEEEIFKMRSKIYRFASNSQPPEWKERGTGDVRFLQHKETKLVRLLMRREKTLRVCANHFIRPWMMVKSMKGSDKAWMWQVHADFADEEAKAEVLAIRFSTPENAAKFKEAFDSAVTSVTEVEATNIKLADTQDTEESDKPSENKALGGGDNESISKKEETSASMQEKSSKEMTDQLKQLTVKEK